jgi:sporulation-control protein spo0M
MDEEFRPLFSDPKCSFPKGKIQVRTENPFYEPGNTVSGSIFIQLDDSVNCDKIKIEVKGKEKGKFAHEWENEAGEHNEELKLYNYFLKYNGKVFEPPDKVLAPGCYVVNFNFALPDNIPSSIFFKDKDTAGNPKCKVKYFIKAKIHGIDGDEDLKHKQVLTIREPGAKLVENAVHEDEAEIKTWCCVSQGISKLKTETERNVYFPNEVVRTIVSIDNSACNVDVKAIRFSLMQRL